MFSRCVAQLKM